MYHRDTIRIFVIACMNLSFFCRRQFMGEIQSSSSEALQKKRCTPNIAYVIYA